MNLKSHIYLNCWEEERERNTLYQYYELDQLKFLNDFLSIKIFALYTVFIANNHV